MNKFHSGREDAPDMVPGPLPALELKLAMQRAEEAEAKLASTQKALAAAREALRPFGEWDEFPKSNGEHIYTYHGISGTRVIRKSDLIAAREFLTTAPAADPCAGCEKEAELQERVNHPAFIHRLEDGRVATTFLSATEFRKRMLELHDRIAALTAELAAEKAKRETAEERGIFVDKRATDMAIEKDALAQEIKGARAEAGRMRAHVKDAIESMTATHYALGTVRPDMEKIEGPDWLLIFNAMSEEYDSLQAALSPEKPAPEVKPSDTKEDK